MPHAEIVFFFFTIALIYASVGFGGGSSYLAVLALYEIPFKEMRLIALICNVIVVTGGTIIFIRNKEVNWKKIIPLVVLSVPMAFMGAAIKLSQHVFFLVLGITLIIASVLLWMQTKNGVIRAEAKPAVIWKDAAAGGFIGFLSGMVGIGGGIFLSPLLNLTHWDTPKKIAATASLFILVNSLSGITGQLSQLPTHINFTRIGLLSVAVFAGGQIGSRIGAVKFPQLIVRRVTAVLVLFAGLEVLIKHLRF